MAVESKTIFGGLGQGYGKIAQILASKKQDLKNSTSDQDNASAADSSGDFDILDVKAQIEMLEKMEQEAKAKEAQYREQDQKLKEKQKDQEKEKQNQQDLVVELLMEEEKRRKVQEFCDKNGLTFSVTKDGNFKITDKEGNEMKSLKQRFDKDFDKSQSNQQER